ncbi:MAG: right-handed parallel beta-helix repeat-containing protein, partial [Deltaproteobacteria bacterium]|nr:right-handed parallel beta-helix repeat-containing protein [Deltaproteobacteria bacterium]
SVRIDRANVTLRGNGAHASVILAPPLDAHGTENPRDPIRVRASGVHIENFWIRQPRRGIIAQGNLDGLAISDVVITQAERDGLTILGGEGITVEGVVVTGSGRYGVYVRTATGVEFRDCDIYENARAGLALARAEVGVHFTTIYSNREGIRNGRSELLLRDSIIAGTERDGLRGRTTDVVTIDHTLFGLNARDIAPSGIPTGAGVLLNTNPLFVDADGPDDVLGSAGWADDDLSLSQVGGGQAVDSPAVDAGSDLASALDVTGSTASNGAPDTGQADLGAHR